ncbi:MAG: hypothetical protein J4215_04445 [Candidatus Diapherotrites archaeon]|uniref:Uncharacterized protein n=1 Tax=Candidatus Iainarchaeum sp. TaxID=3101447 RepID=A0A8T4L3B4_9ARCH|nr:hypothetical protein [Candidatus Diapherotrites archaeon]
MGYTYDFMTFVPTTIEKEPILKKIEQALRLKNFTVTLEEPLPGLYERQYGYVGYTLKINKKETQFNVRSGKRSTSISVFTQKTGIVLDNPEETFKYFLEIIKTVIEEANPEWGIGDHELELDKWRPYDYIHPIIYFGEKEKKKINVDKVKQAGVYSIVPFHKGILLQLYKNMFQPNYRDMFQPENPIDQEKIAQAVGKELPEKDVEK